MKQGQSPYARHKKQPYPYTFPRCSHTHTHAEVFGIVDAKSRQSVKVDVCNVCNTICSTPKLSGRNFVQQDGHPRHSPVHGGTAKDFKFRKAA